MTPDDLRDFLDSLDLYGGRLEAWPDDLRRTAQELLAVSQEARAHLAAMRRAELALVATRGVGSIACDALVAGAMRHHQERVQPVLRRRLPWAAAAVVALVAGVYVGQIPKANDNPTDVVMAALDPSGGHDVW